MTRPRRSTAATVASALLALGSLLGAAAAAQAQAAGAPRWKITSETLPTNLPPAAREVQQVRVYGTGGTFKLAFGGQTTAAVPFDASATEVETALDALSTIGGAGGKVLVSGGPGGPKGGESPYSVTFSGALAFKAVAQLSADSTELTGSPASATVAVAVPGGDGIGVLRVTAMNVGQGAATGVVTLSDALPAGLEASAISGQAAYEQNHESPSRMSCTLATLTCTYDEPVVPGDGLAVEVTVAVPHNAPAAVVNAATVSGGGAAAASVSQLSQVSATPAPFGVVPGSFFAETASSQAGAHVNLTTSFALTTVANAHGAPVAAGSLHDVHVALPTGLVGNTVAVGRCAQVTFYAGECPLTSLIGTASVLYTLGVGAPNWVTKPIYNLVPPEGTPVDLGFEVDKGFTVHVRGHVRTGADYGITSTVEETSAAANVLASTITIWGVPADMSGPGPEEVGVARPVEGERRIAFGDPSAEVAHVPFFTNPTGCGSPLTTSLEVDSWQQVGAFQGEGQQLPETEDCAALNFSPSLEVSPATSATSAPTGLHLDVHVPQNESPEGLGEADVRDAVVQLPEGMTVNASAAAGLEACDPAQIALSSPAPAQCPRASKIGTVEVNTPLVDHPLLGSVYLATQDENPFGALVALYIAIDDPVTGVVVKLAGHVELDQSTGRLTTRFSNTPSLPVEDFKFDLFGGERAPLATPARCGAYDATSDLTPYSSPAAPDATPTSPAFVIDTGCAPQQFTPALTAGTTSNQAGGFSPFTLTMSRENGQQQLDAIQLHMPPGLSGTLTGVELCGEPQADEGTCGPNSLIGETIVSVGVGNNPFVVRGGRVYLTGPYEGAPYGLSIVNPAKAGPFDLEATPAKHPACDCLVVRAKIEVDPTTAALTVTSDTAGPYRIPTMLEGIPLQIQQVNVTITRPSFTFNPTNCAPLALTGTFTSSAGATDALSVPFQATNCARLAFKPGFQVATSAHTSRTNGASLDVKLDYPKAPFGTQANIAKVHVELPKQLPSRLTTLQKACTDTVFDANPAACPAASTVGEATATTPILPVTLAGPAYFVSHGGAKFPELVIVLSGYGTTVELHGETFIDKAGITSTTFNTVPDVPVGAFQLKLPAGPDSALAANGDLCTEKLVMPTTFAAQNGAKITQQTPIAVEGCEPQIRVLRHTVEGKRATIVVSVPSAGTLLAGGHGLSRVTRQVRGSGVVTVTLRLSKADQRFVTHHHGRRLMAPISLSFRPAHGKRLQARVAVLMR